MLAIERSVELAVRRYGGELLSTSHLSANQVSIIGSMVGLGGVCCLFYVPWLGAILYGLAALMDIVDGTVARNNHQASQFGDLLDHTLDRLVDIAFILGVAFAGLASMSFCIFAVTGTLLTSYMGIVPSVLRQRRICSGVLNRPRRVTLLVLGVGLGFPNQTMLLVAIFSWLTFVQRFFCIKRELQKK